MQAKSIPAVILTGGESKRMGQPKHLIDLGDGPLWLTVLKKLEQRFATIAISCRPDQVNDFEGQVCVVDRWPDIGPMGGIASALMHFEHEPAVFVVSCDLPFFDARMADTLFEHYEPADMACCAKLATNDFPDPLVAIWNRSALAPMMEAIDNKDYSLQQLLRAQSYRTVLVEDEQWLLNTNTPEDLLKVSQIQKRET